MTFDAQRDWLVPLPKPANEIENATHFRSTWLTASQATLRERGYGPRYEAALSPAVRETILGVVPGVWLPMEIARAHYAAADTLALPTEELFDLGATATRRANATTLAFAARMAQGVGVTPWTILAQGKRLWDHTCRGGGGGIARLGPKEAHIEIRGFPLAALRYNRVTMRGIVAAVVELFCEKAYVRELASQGDERSIVMRLSWA